MTRRWLCLTLKSVILISIGLVKRSAADIGSINGYPQVDTQQLSPFSLSWNQVHYLVRESLLEIDELRQMQDEFYQELYDCFGLEGCLKEGNVMDGPPQTGGQLGAGALLASLRAERLNLKSRHTQLASSINDIRGSGSASGHHRGGVHTSSSSFRSSRTRTGGANEARGTSYSSQSTYSYSSSSSSSSSSRGTAGDYDDYYDEQGPLKSRG